MEDRYPHLQRHGIAAGEEGGQQIDFRRAEDPNNSGKCGCADGIESEMDQGNSLGVGIGTGAGQQRGNTSADVSAQHDKQSQI